MINKWVVFIRRIVGKRQSKLSVRYKHGYYCKETKKRAEEV